MTQMDKHHSKVTKAHLGHSSRLPSFLYPLSFVPPILLPWKSPKAFVSHPWTLYGIGTIGAGLAAAYLPFAQYLCGTYLMPGITDLSTSASTREQVGSKAATYEVGILCASLVGFFTWFCCFGKAGDIVASRMQVAFIAAVVSQDAGYFDKHGCGEISARATKDIAVIRKGYGEHLGWLVWCGLYIIINLTVCFTTSVKLTAVLLPFLPVLFAMFALTSKATNRLDRISIQTKDAAVTFLEQCFSGIRVVQTFAMQRSLINHWNQKMLVLAERTEVKSGLVHAGESAWLAFGTACIWSVAYYYGDRLVRGGMPFGYIITVAFNIANVYFFSRSRKITIERLREASRCVQEMRRHIERQPHIDIRETRGLDAMQESHASFTFQEVTMAYPSRPDKRVLNKATFTVEPGQLTAIVGPSGAGKSSIAALLMRRYDPATANVSHRHEESMHDDQPMSREPDDEVRLEKGMVQTKPPSAPGRPVEGGGVVTFGTRDIREYNLKSLRSCIGIVFQEPQLSPGSILENVAAGLSGTAYEHQPGMGEKELAIVREKCIAALKLAEAWDFVRDLDDGIDTHWSGGRSGGILSGGQQQRIAIARALVREPRVLILDEATSAVSGDVELKVRENIARESQHRGMTVVSIAHRLQFARNANKIIVLKDGAVADQGSYGELLEDGRPDDTFAEMVNSKSKRDSDLDLALETGSMSSALTFDAKTAHSRSQDDVEASKTLEKDHNSSNHTIETTIAEITQNTADERVLVPDSTSTAMTPTSSPRLLYRLGHRRLHLFLGIICAILFAGVLTAFPWVQGKSTAKVAGDTSRPSIGIWCLVWLGVAAASAILVYGQESLTLTSYKRLERQLSIDTVTAVMAQDMAYFETPETTAGALSASMSRHPGSVAETATVISARLINQVLSVIGLIIMTHILEWRYVVYILPFLVFAVGVGWLQSWASEKTDRIQSAEQDAVSSLVNGAVDSMETVSALGQEARVVERLEQELARFVHLGWTTTVQHASHAMGQTMGSVILAMLLWRGARMLARGEISLSSLFAVQEAAFGIAFGFSPTVQFLNEVSAGKHSWGVLRQQLSRDPVHARVDRQDNVDYKAAMSGDIVFKSVSMRYSKQPDRLALNSVDLRIQAGKVNAITGLSGGGKSTVINLLQRLYDPSSGKITFSGIDCQSIPLDVLQSHLAIVSQHSVLFEGDFRFNLCLGAKDPENVTQVELDSVCREVGILDFVLSLPEGFATDIGLKGTRLSGGQKQRLCIARALLRNPTILLLDEATSSLDAASEVQVELALQNVSKGRTVVVVAHRLQSIRQADHISVIEDGRVVEQGTHQNMVQARGKHFELLRGQL